MLNDCIQHGWGNNESPWQCRLARSQAYSTHLWPSAFAPTAKSTYIPSLSDYIHVSMNRFFKFTDQDDHNKKYVCSTQNICAVHIWEIARFNNVHVGRIELIPIVEWNITHCSVS